MWLRELSLTNFRSYGQRTISLGQGLTIVAGPNASGKTNLLEAVYTLAVTKSFRAKDLDLIKHGQEHFRIAGQIGQDEYSLAYQKTDGAQTKKAAINGAKKTLSSHIGNIQTVLFEPSDMELVSGAPELRRRYLDFILCQTSRPYLVAMAQYRRVLKQRNKLLSSFDTSRIAEEIFAWDLKLAELAVEIVNARIMLLSRIAESADSLYADIAGDSIGLKFDYLPSVKGDYSRHFMDSLKHNFTRDLAAGFTTIGPHREDFRVWAGDKPLTVMASRGEVRTVVLVLKLAELSFCETITGQKPILLLDDVFSELDQSRRGYLMNTLGEHQTIITTTDADSVVAGLTVPYSLIETAVHV